MLWITGAVLPLALQLPFWAAALGLELIGTVLGYPVPGLGRVKIASWDVSGPHIAERTALFVLIALGEGLLVTGFAFVAMESSTEGIIAMVAAFVAAASAWWIYFDHGERIGAEAIEAADEPGRLVRTAYTWIHLAIIAGIVLLSVGDKEALGHPHAHSLAATVVVLGGPAAVPDRHRAVPARARAAVGARPRGRRGRHPGPRARCRRSSTCSASRSPSRCCWPRSRSARRCGRRAPGAARRAA